MITAGDDKAAAQAAWAEQGRYRWLWPSVNGRGQEVRFCWSTETYDGMYRSWREVVGKNVFKRDRILARKKRSQVREIARKRHNAYATKLEKET